MRACADVTLASRWGHRACAEAELIRAVREQAALRLYADGRVTTGEAAGILGMTRIQFLDLMRRSGVEFRAELDEEDFAQLKRHRDEYPNS